MTDPEQATDGVAVDVCLCAHLRPQGLRACLESLATQVGAPRFSVVIADNHAEPMVAAWIERESMRWPFGIRVVHAPAHNISVARNACLDAASAPWIAFIDDDETADPDWLSRLMEERAPYDVLFGPVFAQYPASAPAWLIEGDFLSKIPPHRNGRLHTGHSANALVRRRAIGDRRFDLDLGQTGGEDTLWFANLAQAGLRLGYTPRAVVREQADPQRSTLSALARRARASGHAHARVLRLRGQSRPASTLVAASKCMLLLLGVLIGLPSRVSWRRQWLRAALQWGVLAHGLGARPPRIYGSPRSHSDHRSS